MPCLIFIQTSLAAHARSVKMGKQKDECRCAGISATGQGVENSPDIYVFFLYIDILFVFVYSIFWNNIWPCAGIWRAKTNMCHRFGAC